MATLSELEFSDAGDIHDLEPRRQLDFSPIFTTIYFFVCTLCLLAVTTAVKALTDRERPSSPPEGSKNSRHYDLRSLESNKSFPSGDTAQAALHMSLVMAHFKHFFMMMGGPLGIAQFVMMVAFARVYFHCHYVGDTIGGALTGTTVASLLVKF